MSFLSRLYIENFRSIKSEFFNFKPLLSLPTVLIGRNNSGKTNILEAIRILLEGTSKDVTGEDFFETGKDFIIEARFCGIRKFLPVLDQRHKPRVEECIDDKDFITVRRVGSSSDRSLSPIQIKNVANGSFGTPTGIDAALRQFLPQVVYVRPLADVADEVSSKATSTLAKILAQIRDEVRCKAQPLIEKAFRDIETSFNVTVDPNDPNKELKRKFTEITEIEDRVTRYLQETFPEARVRLKVAMPDTEQILGNMDVLVHDGVLWKPYYRQGHGIQRVLLLSLLRTLAIELRERPQSATRRPFILLIEEPELFLYPAAQEQMRDALVSISKSNQVIYSTHSPLLISPDQLAGVIRLHKRFNSETRLEETKVAGSLGIGDMPKEKDLLNVLSLQRSAKWLFSDTVVLVEGVSDYYLHKAAFQRVLGSDLESEGIALVEVGGKDKIASFKKVLKRFCARVLALVDVDYLWKGAENELNSDRDVDALVKHCHRIVRERLQDLKDTVDGGGYEKQLAKEKRKCCFEREECDVREKVCDKLELLGTFVLRRGDIEAYAGLEEWSKGKYLEVAREIQTRQRNLNFESELRELYRRLKNWQSDSGG